MKNFTVLFALCLALVLVLAAGPAQAANRAGSFNLSPFVGYHLFDGGQDLKERATFGVRFGYNFTKNFGLEAAYSYTPTKSDLGLGDAKAHLYHLDGLYHFMPDSKFVPYLAFGLGGATFKHDWRDDDTTFAGNLGGGFKYFFTENVAFRLDVRDYLIAEDSHNNVQATVGLTFQFGGGAPVIPPKKPEQVQQEKSYKMVVLFDFDKTIIKPEFQSDLQKMADFMKQYPAAKAQIDGHTDSIGTDQYNQGLSNRRASAVKDYLVNKLGIAADRISVKGFGETKPVATNATKEGRKQNRRAEGATSAIEVTVK